MNSRTRGVKEKTPLKFSDEVRELFREGGPISRVFSTYEVRDEQIDYASEVARLIDRGGLLVVEAGTGVGKSIAYLIPSILWAVRNKKRLTISTHTKNLQNQLTDCDTPLARSALKEDFLYFSLKGKGNYLCLKRLEEARAGTLSLGGGESEAITSVEKWLEEVSFEASSDLSYPGAGNSSWWPHLSADGMSCEEEECELKDECLLRKARKKAFQATVLVVNHSLLVRDFVMGGGYLPERDLLIIDEAHNIERVITEELSVSLGRNEVKELARRTFGRGRSGGILGRLKKRIPSRKGKKRKNEALESLSSSLFLFSEALENVIEEIESRIASAAGLERRVRYGEEFISLVGETGMKETEKRASEVSTRFDEFETFLAKDGDGDSKVTPSLLFELKSLRSEWERVFKNFMFLSHPSSPEYVYWLEFQGGGLLALKASPVSVSEKAQELFFGSSPRTLLTSATLTVEGSFAYFLKKLGISEGGEVATFLLGSPFDYRNNVFFGTARDFPVPGENAGIENVFESLSGLLLGLKKNALLLFTSYDSLRRTYFVLKRSLERSGVAVVGQGIDGTAAELARLFGRRRQTVLLGTTSLWEGVDFPGEELELLFIARLPFPVPKDPLVEAKSEILASQGFEPFPAFHLPEAVTRFRQGFGRLIRRKEDRGACIVLDPRIVIRDYGEAFTSSVPSSLRVFERSEELFEGLRKWFS